MKLAFMLWGVVCFWFGIGLHAWQFTPPEPEPHPYDRCVQLLGKYITSTINPVQAEVLIDSCLKKRK